MKRTITLMLAASAFTLTGCDQVKKIDEGNETGGGGGVPTAVQERLTASCATSTSCHVSGGLAPDLSGGTAWLTQSGAGGPYVSFGDVDNSYLVQKMLGSSGITGGIMPPAGQAELAPEDLAVIVGWVAGVEFPSETGPATTSGTGDTGGETSEGETTEGGELISCSLTVVDPNAESPVVSGDGAGVIPSSIGTALEENCGCHYTDSVSSAMYFPYSGGTQMQTLENFTDDYAGAVSTYMGMAAWMSVQDRVITQATMPTAICEVEGGGIMSAADFALFEAWFEQGVPDGASFTPPG